MRRSSFSRLTTCDIVVIATLVVCPAVHASASGQKVRVNQDALLVDEFQKKVADYVKLHRDAAAKVPPLKSTDSPTRIDEYQRALASMIRAARPQARQGDVFTSPIAAEFRRLIKITMRGPQANLIHASLRRGEPVSLTVSVNDAYPPTVPLQTAPSSLLLNLPKLPPEVEYRVVGHNLVLRDVAANLIVDFLPGAVF